MYFEITVVYKRQNPLICSKWNTGASIKYLNQYNVLEKTENIKLVPLMINTKFHQQVEDTSKPPN